MELSFVYIVLLISAAAVGVVVIAIRITRDHRANLVRPHRILSTLLKHHPDMVAVTNELGVIAVTSKLFQASMDCRDSKRQVNLFEDLFRRRGRLDYQKILDYVHRERKPLVDHRVHLRIGGQERELDLTLAPVVDPAGNILALIHILRPARDRGEAAADLGHIEKLTNIGQIAAGMAHELNTPLGSIILSTDIVLDQSTDAESVIEEISKIRAQADHCSKVVQQLLSYVRKDEGFKAVQDLEVVIGKVVELVGAEARKRQIAIEIQTTPEKAEILGNGNQIEQLFFNLLSNAFQAIDRNGSIVIQIGRDALLKQVTVSVADTGGGITEDHLDKIFDPFFTTKAGKEGTGLGLALCRKIMMEHGGRVTVESRVDQGTTFELYFPTVE